MSTTGFNSFWSIGDYHERRVSSSLLSAHNHGYRKESRQSEPPFVNPDWRLLSFVGIYRRA